jgi:Coenzyme PQQ synthesis protein D (PqqD)
MNQVSICIAKLPQTAHSTGMPSGSVLSERLGRPSGSKGATPFAKHTLEGVEGSQDDARARYRVNAPQVIAETIGGEAMIVNLANGHYFSLQGSGVDIWAGIERQSSLSELVRTLEARYSAADGEIETAVRELIEELEHEDLIVDIGENGAGADVEVGYALASVGAPAANDRIPFAQPSLAKFTDMQDIILLDPVHEVDARGWPHASASS